jgi:hypothetical protein
VYNLLNAVTNDERCSPDFLEGAKVNAVLDAMSKSAETRKWVSVPKIVLK